MVNRCCTHASLTDVRSCSDTKFLFSIVILLSRVKSRVLSPLWRGVYCACFDFFPLFLMCGSCGCGSGCCQPCVACKVLKALVALVLTLTTIAALLGVWHAHNTPSGWMFGSGDGSLSILALVFSVVLWHKVTKKMCPCQTKCCSGGGMCGKCGKDPCACAKEPKHHGHEA